MTQMMKLEDDVLEEYVINQLEEMKIPDPKKIQIYLTGFLGSKNAKIFVEQLWELLLSAQESDIENGNVSKSPYYLQRSSSRERDRAEREEKEKIPEKKTVPEEAIKKANEIKSELN
ncbi:hypothetical protein PVAND_004022 [Polypedilum vanderplanki]|uniref:PWI domain-containing protein n=1 Tax=Polypedilum vanderplanki TaxID=319348 RepID=A0A9J6BVV2_POLVA|nr:hypothetical protein PVAND_004022 [Polypedilum vanderplanki]